MAAHYKPETRFRLRDFAKRAFDVTFSFIVFVVAAPLMAVIAVLIAMDGGPVFSSHSHLGRHGRSFGRLKFRTIAAGDDRASGAVASMTQAGSWNRTSPSGAWQYRLGHLLHDTALDELPLLFNVLRGDMSWVGPAPVTVDEFLSHYTGTSANAYVSVRPGITGLWQTSGLRDTRFERRVELDCAYVSRRSLAGDVRLLARTMRILADRSEAT